MRNKGYKAKDDSLVSSGLKVNFKFPLEYFHIFSECEFIKRLSKLKTFGLMNNLIYPEIYNVYRYSRPSILFSSRLPDPTSCF